MRYVTIILLAGLVTGCVQDGPDSGPIENRRVNVVATTGMVADLARHVGGDRVSVEAIMGPGVDPHLYKARESDLGRLRRADLILYSGLHLEGKMAEVLEKLGESRPVSAVAEGVDPGRLLAAQVAGGHPDPHVWFDVALWASFTDRVAGALADVDPTHADGYRSRAEAYRATLLDLDREVHEAIATIPAAQRVLVTSHDAFRYFGRAYDIEVRGLQGISTVLAAGVNDRRGITDLVLARGVKAIFVESSVPPDTIEAVQEDCREKGREVAIGGKLFSDAMGDTPPEDTYVGMVRSNVRKIVEALR